jgi:hypothetical protein
MDKRLKCKTTNYEVDTIKYYRKHFKTLGWARTLCGYELKSIRNKSKNSQMELPKIKNLCTAKVVSEKPTYRWEKLGNCTSEKELIFRNIRKLTTQYQNY